MLNILEKGPRPKDTEFISIIGYYTRNIPESTVSEYSR